MIRSDKNDMESSKKTISEEIALNNKIITLEINMAELKRDIDYIKKSSDQNINDHKAIIQKIDDFIGNCENKYVSQEAFRPVQKIAYGLSGTILTAVVLGLVYLLIK